MTWFNRSDEILVSVVNEAGPYVSLSSMRWYDKDIYTAFVYKKLLTQKVMMRNFRLGLSLPVLCYFNQVPFDSTMGFIHQISKEGVLFKIMGLNNFNRFISSRTIKFEVDLSPFQGIESMDVNKILNHFSRTDFNDFSSPDKNIYVLNSNRLMEYYDNSLNCRSNNGREFYIFASYDDFKENSTPHSMKEIFRHLIVKIEAKLQRELNGHEFALI
jgi:hypothetical protein